MGIWDKIRGEFIDIIEWLDDTQDVIVYRFERHGNEIKHGAQLTVRESQLAVFVNEGEIADVFEPGMHTLITQNLPILSTLQGWKYGLNSPFKAEVYFVNTKRFTDQKWGTMNPVMMRDPDFGVVRVRAFGTFGFRIADSGKFLKEISGTDWQFTTDEVHEHLRNQIVSAFSERVASLGVPVIDLAAKYSDLGEQIRNAIQPSLEEIGVEVVNFQVENVSVPPEVEKAIDKRSSMGVVGDLGAFTQFQAAQAMEKAAENPGGMGAAGVGMGMGMAMGPILQQSMQQAPSPPPLAGEKVFHVAISGQQQGPYGFEALRGMVAAGTLTRESLVWTPGMPDWLAAGQVADLIPIFAATPPPIPPQ